MMTTLGLTWPSGVSTIFNSSIPQGLWISAQRSSLASVLTSDLSTRWLFFSVSDGKFEAP